MMDYRKDNLENIIRNFIREKKQKGINPKLDDFVNNIIVPIWRNNINRPKPSGDQNGRANKYRQHRENILNRNLPKKKEDI